MLAALDISYQFFLTFVFGMPFFAIGLGYYDRAKWLLMGFLVGLLLLCVSLGLLAYVIWAYVMPNTTGMEGIAFVVLPLLFAGSVVISAVCFVLVRWLFARKSKADT